MGGACTTYGERRGVDRVLVENPEGMRPLVRTWLRWEDNNEMDIQEVGWKGIEWIDLVQDRDRWWALVYVVMHFRVP
jgi:hypothetical protein